VGLEGGGDIYTNEFAACHPRTRPIPLHIVISLVLIDVSHTVRGMICLLFQLEWTTCRALTLGIVYVFH